MFFLGFCLHLLNRLMLNQVAFSTTYIARLSCLHSCGIWFSAVILPGIDSISIASQEAPDFETPDSTAAQGVLIIHPQYNPSLILHLVRQNFKVG
jgi:hypothetical protein